MSVSPLSLSYSSGVNFYIPTTPPANTPPELLPAFTQLYNTMQIMINSLILNAGISSQPLQNWSSYQGNPITCRASNVQRIYIPVTENCAEGAPVYLSYSGGELVATLASASSYSTGADGFCNTVGGSLAGQIAEIILGNGVTTSYGTGAAFTPGSRYWLGTTPGSYSTSPPTGSGVLQQYLGFAFNSSQLYFTTADLQNSIPNQTSGTRASAPALNSTSAASGYSLGYSYQYTDPQSGGYIGQVVCYVASAGANQWKTYGPISA